MPTIPYTLRIDPELKLRLEAEARREKRSSAFILQQAAAEYLDRRERLHATIAALEAEADKGVFVSEEAVTAWVESWDTDDELPEPSPDIMPARKQA